jgi:hypothetical protein
MDFEFELPRGYVDAQGDVHRQGAMRLATALDEVEPLRDPRVQANEAYLIILLLARVVTRIGAITDVNTQVIEGLYASDLAYLQDLYQRINAPEPTVVGAVCPHCSTQFQLQVAPMG